MIRAMRLVGGSGGGEHQRRDRALGSDERKGSEQSMATHHPHPWLLQRIVLFVFIYILIGSLQQLWESRQQGGQDRCREAS